MQFANAVRELVRDTLKETTHTVQGYVPNGKINMFTWLAEEVKIPHPHAGSQPTTDGGGVTLTNVPLPKSFSGFLMAIKDEVLGVDRAVLVGFKGGRQSFPHIIQFLDPVAPLDKQQHENLQNRNSVQDKRLQTVGGIHSQATAGPILPDPAGADGNPWNPVANPALAKLKRQAAADPLNHRGFTAVDPAARFLTDLAARSRALSERLIGPLGQVLKGSPAPQVGTPGIAPH
jgi:hypothetical protein